MALMKTRFVAAVGACLTLVCARLPGDEPPRVNESKRQIPVAYSVDVVVVGGSSGAVAAAVAASGAGAKVFLAAPRPYLGDDMTATLRLWLEDGETPRTPLAKSLFDDRVAAAEQRSPNRIRFQYQADQPTAARHPETEKPSVLADSVWRDPTKHSVQYDEDVNITVDLGLPRDVAQVNLWAFHQSGAGGYRVGSLAVSLSDDGKKWRPGVTVEPPRELTEISYRLPATLSGRARYLKLAVKKAAGAKRMLLGEIEVLAPAADGGPPPAVKRPWPRPMHLKQTLDQALLAAGGSFLYNCHATDVLHDADGRLCGIVMANRAGRQAVLAKTIIDATERAVVARLAGARFRPYPAGPQTFRRTVIGGQMQSGPGLRARMIEPPFVGYLRTSEDDLLYPIFEYTLELPLAGDDDASWARADQEARTRTYHPDQQFTSDVLFQVPPDPLFGRETATGTWQGVAQLPGGAFRPKDLERLLVLGGCADVSREQAEKLVRPLAIIDLGERLGAQAAAESQRLPAPAGAHVRGKPTVHPVERGQVRELLGGVRPNQQLPASAVGPSAGVSPTILPGAAAPHGLRPGRETVPQSARAVPVLGRYDVVVIGGGTAGAPAGIAAARQGAKTLVVEQLSGLGGVGTTGAISNYCAGNRVGFTASVGGGNTWVIEQKMEWWRRELLQAGADIWFGCVGCGALVDADRGNQVLGAVVVTPRGRGVVLAKAVVDATGNADVAAAAGAACRYTDESEFAMQGTGLPPRQLGASYTNTDYTYTDETDLVDVWHLLVYAKEKFSHAFDLGQLVDTRERRRIVGDFTLTVLDQMSGRTYPDTIAKAMAGYDTHGYIIEPCFLLRHPSGKSLTSYVPYRCLLPKGLEGLLVTGIGLSAHRDAQPVVRMQPDIQNQGYAAGAAAAMAARAGTLLRHIEMRALQKHLVEIGNLPESVLTDGDSHPLPDDRVAEAVRKAPDDFRSLAIVLSHRDTSLPLLRAAHRQASSEQRLAYAKMLGMLGDPTGLDTLVAEVERARTWDTVPSWRLDKDFPEPQRVGWLVSHLDNTLMALGRTQRPEAVPTVLKMLASLRPGTAFSHHRAVYLAAEWLGDPRAARPLADLLKQPDMSGHAVTAIDQRATSARSRSSATRELLLARALYRCGDWEGMGERALGEYAQDLRGHFARHAQAVLAAGKRYRPQP
jgi:hypothetical protein